MFSTPPGKNGKGSKHFGGNINLYCSSHIEFKISYKLAIMYSRSRDPLIFRDIHNFKIRYLENVGQGDCEQHSQCLPFDGKFLTCYLMTIIL